MWTSGAPSAAPAGRSARVDVMVLYQVPGKNMRLEGTLIDAAKIESQEACSDRCKTDPLCLALEHESSEEVCRRFSDVTGIREAPTDKNFVAIETKRQR